MLFSTTFLLSIATAAVSAEAIPEVNLPSGWVPVAKREAPSNKVWDRLVRRNQQASQTSQTLNYVAPPQKTTTLAAPAPSLTTAAPTVSSTLPSISTLTTPTSVEEGLIQTTVEYVATSCNSVGLCTTTTVQEEKTMKA